MRAGTGKIISIGMELFIIAMLITFIAVTNYQNGRINMCSEMERFYTWEKQCLPGGLKITGN